MNTISGPGITDNNRQKEITLGNIFRKVKGQKLINNMYGKRMYSSLTKPHKDDKINKSRNRKKKHQ